MSGCFCCTSTHLNLPNRLTYFFTSQIGETVWARVGPTWHVGLVISPEYQKSFAVRPFLFPLSFHLSHTQIIPSPPTNPRPTKPYLPTVRTWDIAILSPTHPTGVHTTPLSPALGHLKPATPAVLGVLQHEGLIPRAWVYGAPEVTCQVYELHKRLGAAGIPF